MATEKIQIIVSEKGTVTVKKNLDAVGKSSRSASEGMNVLKGALAAFISLQGIQALTGLADAGTQLSNTLKVAGLSGDELASSQQMLFDLAKANGQNVNDLAAVYQKLKITQDQLNASGEQTDHVLKVIASSMKLSSAGTAAQAGALQQLSQLLGGVRVQAQEYNSLIDGAYPLLQAVAAGSDRWGGSVAKLTQDVKAASVSSKEFFDALLKGGDVNIALAASFNFTIGQALTNFRTNLIEAVSALNQSTNAFGILANAINFVGNNLKLVATVLTPFIAALTFMAVQTVGGLVIGALTGMVSTLASIAVTLGTVVIPAIISFGTSIVSAVIPAVVSLTTAMLTNPLFMVGAAAAVAGVVIFQERLRELAGTIRDTVSEIAGLDKLGNMLNGVFNIEVHAKELADAAGKIKGSIQSGGSSAAKDMKEGIEKGAKNGAAELEKAAQATYERLNGGLVKSMGKTLTESGDYFVNKVTGEVTKAGDTIKQSVSDGGEQAGNYIQQSMENGSATVYSTIESAFATLGPILDVFRLAMSQARRDIMKTIAEANNLNAEARKARAEAAELEKRFKNGGTGGGGGGGGGIVIQEPLSSIEQRNQQMLNEQRARQQAGYTGTVANQNTSGPMTNNPYGNVNITNVLDPGIVVEANKTSQGQQSIVNVIKANREEIQSVLGVA